MSDSSPVYGAVLCAGYGTRMAPITDILPKPLIPFLNTPTITYSINHLARAGVTRVCCNLHHLADSIPPVVDRLGAAMGVEMVYAREWEILGTAGGVERGEAAITRGDVEPPVGDGEPAALRLTGAFACRDHALLPEEAGHQLMLGDRRHAQVLRLLLRDQWSD